MNQHSMPVMVKGEKAISLEKVSLHSTSYNEDWIQDLCFKHPSLLPFIELEPIFDRMIPICRELATESGNADLLYINKDGFIAIGECKLWRNPDARRRVVGQILDYAKDLALWDYSKFESECLKAGKWEEKSLFEVIQKKCPDMELEESEFIDNVQKNLQKGRFLLLIIGDGIKENMEELVKYIHRNGNLHFTLGLIELPVYKNEEKELIITPRILAKTREIERIIYRISEKPIEEDSQVKQGEERSQTISEKVFFERLTKNIGIEKTEAFEQLIATLDSQFNIQASLGRSKITGTINLKLPNGYNFGTIYENGGIYFIQNGRWENNEEFQLKYIKKIAGLVNGEINEAKVWRFIRKTDGKIFVIPDLLAVKDKWIEILTETIDEIYRLEDDD